MFIPDHSQIHNNKNWVKEKLATNVLKISPNIPFVNLVLTRRFMMVGGIVLQLIVCVLILLTKCWLGTSAQSDAAIVVQLGKALCP